MKKRTIFLIILFIFMNNIIFGWGFWAHSYINRTAVFSLPPKMFGFYKRNINYITNHAVDPDKIRYIKKGEAENHFIDLDNYPEFVEKNEIPYWKDAINKYTEDSIKKNGVLPWNILWTYRKLSDAFEKRDSAKILKYSSYLGHYISDACVPLHTTSNYNGQKTNQKGIHALWETKLPMNFAKNYNIFVGKAKFIDHPFETACIEILNSHKAVDSVLSLEMKLNNSYPNELKYSIIEYNNTYKQDYSIIYINLYHNALDGMVERQMRKAIYLTASYWYTAWVNAGQPDLDFLDTNIKSDINEDLPDSIAISKIKSKNNKIHDCGD